MIDELTFSTNPRIPTATKSWSRRRRQQGINCHVQKGLRSSLWSWGPEAMFATAILWARKLGPRPVKLANLGEQVQVASQTLYKIIEQHGPITLSDCWNHASQMENHGLKSKRHMKMMLRWMRERRTVRLICKHGEDGKSSDPNEREFLFTVVPPKVDREPRATSQRDSAPPPAE